MNDETVFHVGLGITMVGVTILVLVMVVGVVRTPSMEPPIEPEPWHLQDGTDKSKPWSGIAAPRGEGARDEYTYLVRNDDVVLRLRHTTDTAADPCIELRAPLGSKCVPVNEALEVLRAKFDPPEPPTPRCASVDGTDYVGPCIDGFGDKVPAMPFEPLREP